MQKANALFVFLLTLMTSGQTFAWGTATHAYLAKGAGQGNLNSQEIYGATVPDLFNLMLDSLDYDYLVDRTHYHYGNVKKKARGMGLESFAFGFVSHNEKWGADDSAHRNGWTTREGYIIAQSTLLGPQLRPQVQVILENSGVPLASLVAGVLAPQLAHPIIETAIDLLIKRNENPLIGQELLQSALDRSSIVPDLLVAAYGKSLARRMNVSEEGAGSFIRDAEGGFREMMIRYGEILSKDEEEAIQDLANEGAALIQGYIESATGTQVEVPPEVLVEFLHLAIQQVEENYNGEIAATLSHLQQRLNSYLRSIVNE
jgi:hypothetical protein